MRCPATAASTSEATPAEKPGGPAACSGRHRRAASAPNTNVPHRQRQPTQTRPQPSPTTNDADRHLTQPAVSNSGEVVLTPSQPQAFNSRITMPSVRCLKMRGPWTSTAMSRCPPAVPRSWSPPTGDRHPAPVRSAASGDHRDPSDRERRSAIARSSSAVGVSRSIGVEAGVQATRARTSVEVMISHSDRATRSRPSSPGRS